MYLNPYLRKPDVPGASRCRFEFSNAEIVSMEDDYTGKRRYHFNKWMPISQGFPRLKGDGLLFEPNPTIPLVGMASAWEIDPTDIGDVTIAFGPQSIKSFDATAGDTISMGIGFLRYTSKWWRVDQGCELLCVRQWTPAPLRKYFHLNDVEDTSVALNYNPNNPSVFRLEHTPNRLSIEYTEYDVNTGLITVNDTQSLAIDPADATKYRIVVFFYGSGGARYSIPLSRATINLPLVKFQPTEIIFFLENPSSYKPPQAPLRTSTINLYHHYHKALIEDGTISVANNYASDEWWNTLKYLVEGPPDTFLFTDPNGVQFRCVFQDLQATHLRRTAERGRGYELTMLATVVH